MGNKVTRTVSLTPEANQRIREGDNGQPWNASQLLEEAIWARAGLTTSPKIDLIERAANEAREKARKEVEAMENAQRAQRAPYLERFDRLVALWRTTSKEKGFESSEEREVNSELDRLISEAKEKGVILVKPVYANAQN